MNYKSRNNQILRILVMILFLVILICFSFSIGRYPISIKELIGIICSRICSIKPYWSTTKEMILFNIRLPRILLATLVGCVLPMAGAAYQGIFQNPMASPDILGASQGAAFGAALAILLGAPSQLITLSAFCFSLITVIIVYVIGSKTKVSPIMGLILSGIMISSIFQSGTSFIKLVADPSNQLPAITYWLMGSLSNAKISDVLFVIIPMLIGAIPILLLRWRLNILTLGDDEAYTLGVDANKVRLIIILSSTILVASAVSVSGVIGWIGLVIPHLSRRIVGNDFRYLIPMSMVLGSTFLLIVDNISRNLLSVEIPIGILTAFVGAPFFIYLMMKRGYSI